jgi:phosphonate utilization transcriptional regulator
MHIVDNTAMSNPGGSFSPIMCDGAPVLAPARPAADVRGGQPVLISTRPAMPQTTPFELLRSMTLSGLVEEEILRGIKSGELTVGAKLNEIELSKRLGISRSPVREAFRALEEAGLVRFEKNRGVFIRDISDEEAAELYEVRAGLDEMAGRLLAPKIGAEQIAELGGLLHQLESSATGGGINRYFELNVAFHDRLIEMTGNTTLLGIYRQVVNRMHLLRRRGFSLAGSSAASHTEHRVILDALATREAEATARAMRQHVEHGFQRALTAHHLEENTKPAPATG